MAYLITLRCKKYSREVATGALFGNYEQAFGENSFGYNDDPDTILFWKQRYQTMVEHFQFLLDEKHYEIVLADVERWVRSRGWQVWDRTIWSESARRFTERQALAQKK